MTKKHTRAPQVERLARDGAILSASLVLSVAYDVLTPQQQRLVTRVNRAAVRLLSHTSGTEG